MAFSKIILNGETLMDVTQDTVSTDTLISSYTAHDASGQQITGEANLGVKIWQDEDGYVVLDDEQGENATSLTSLTITENGVYNAPSGVAYKSVIVDGFVPQKQINFIDYDGTIVESYTVAEAQSLTALPENPSHTGLVSQGWNWSLADIKSYLTKYPDGIVNVGQMYITASGRTEIDIEFNNPVFLSPYLAIGINGTCYIDWGDGSARDTVTGTSYANLKYIQHIYTSVGKYTITINSGPIKFNGNSGEYASLLSDKDSYSKDRTYSQCVTSIRCGSNAQIGNYAFKNCNNLQNITIPNTLTSIGRNAFENCYTLQSITIPDGVTSIDEGTFEYCYSVQNITIPDGVTSIGNNAIQSCYALQNITIPDGVTSIGSNAFSNCYALQSIIVPNGVTSIGTGAFNSCYALKSITIPNILTNIENYTFNSCRAIRSIIIPNGVTSIGNNAFQFCYGLQTITIPDSVTNIGNNAFYNCDNITEYNLKPSTPPTIGTSAFHYGGVIYVPKGSLETYQTATNWSNYASYMREEVA